MKKSFTVFIFFLLIISFLFTQIAFAEENVGFVKRTWRKVLNAFRRPTQELTPQPKTEPETRPKPKEEPKESPLSKLSEEELRERIKHMLEVTPEVADFVPELKDINLEEADKDTLIKIHNRIANERTRIQTERIQRQLEAARAAQQVQSRPQVYIPPSPPKTSTPPPTPPKVQTPPPPPPAPPRR